jgi:hypothetical protein
MELSRATQAPARLARTVSRATLVFKEHASLLALSRLPASRPAAPREPDPEAVGAAREGFSFRPTAVAFALLGGEMLVAHGRRSIPHPDFFVDHEQATPK